ncbi:outer membrane protein [Bartonella sp. DGB2]|uniref:outer membrane protein n=1 Tax=Bartonella sp. DGB2 TaxID=3388426 RepID=UPI00398FF267
MELKSTAPVLKVTKDATVSFEQKWSGATRVRLGFAVDRFMPYLAGGISYTSVNGTSVSNDTATVARNSKTDTIQHKTILHFLQNYITLSTQHLLNHLKIAKSCLVLPLVLVLTLR